MSESEKYIRITVTGRDDSLIYGKCAAGSGEEIRILYSDGEWLYLKQLLHRGAQVNVVNPSFENGICHPGLIILEPDYLVEVTAVAGCFEEYGHRPLINLLHKIAPKENSKHIMLGNLAGQLLDCEVHTPPENNPYDAAYSRYIRQNAFDALTTDIKGLQREGQLQKDNIHKALSADMAGRTASYNREKVILEPSFFCEMLGLQGRMDFLQTDCRVLLEQKSGKGRLVPGKHPDDPPASQLKHQVQLLLYRAMLHYGYGMPEEEIRSFLLYSKFANGLIEPESDKELLLEAIRIRNMLVWHEMNYAERGFARLHTFTPLNFCAKEGDHDYNPAAFGKLWNNFIIPQINGILDPLKNASPLEREYYYRFMRFLEKERLLSKVGNGNADQNGFSAKWNCQIEEKRESGNIFDGLELSIPQQAGSAIRTVDMVFSDGTSAESANFRKGDIVVAYPYSPGEEPDVRKTIVFRGTLVELTSEKAVLELRSPQSDSRVFDMYEGSPWAMEHDFIESSYSHLYRGMYAILTAPQSRRDLLLLQREPRTDSTRRLAGDYGRFNELSGRIARADDLFLVIGPPGTGKTSFGMLFTVKEELAQLQRRGSGKSILIMAYTNRAVDEICTKLAEEGIDFIRLGHVHSCEKAFHGNLLDKRLESVNDFGSMRALIENARVIVGTTASVNARGAIFKIKSFSLAIIDEASQILEPHLIGILCARHGEEPAIAKTVMIGDHRQLPAVVLQDESESKVNEPLLQGIFLTDCRLSLFERLLRRYGKDPSVTYMLTRQGRMHHDIAQFPNLAFYGGALEEVPLPHQIEKSEADGHRVLFFNVPVPDGGILGKVNHNEAEMIAEEVVKIYRKESETFDALRTVGVIVPYRSQIAAIRKRIDEYGYPDLHDIAIDTVERFQGSQRDYILYGFTVSRPEQLDFLSDSTFEEEGALIDRKLNVAMTRARRYLLMFGNAQLLERNEVFRRMIEFIRDAGGYRDNHNV